MDWKCPNCRKNASRCYCEPEQEPARPFIMETVSGGIWSLTVSYGRGEAAMKAMRAQADALRKAMTTPPERAAHEGKQEQTNDRT